MVSHILVNIGLGNGLPPVRDKPLPDPLSIDCELDPPGTRFIEIGITL